MYVGLGFLDFSWVNPPPSNGYHKELPFQRTNVGIKALLTPYLGAITVGGIDLWFPRSESKP